MAHPLRVGRYEILERLGEGGMGAVYLGNDPNIGRQIAVKVLHGHLTDSNLRLRFAQEARSAGSLTHPNIVTVHDFGEVDGAPYLVMEYVRGLRVAKVIKQREFVPLATKLEWLEGLCAGLHYAHESRIIHRDVKPQNLMVDDRGTLKILDFGIARVAESGLTKMSNVIGTPGYMSPEQIESRGIDRRSDIFSAGAVGFALISYREAFEGDSVASVMHRVLTSDPPPLSDICSGLPASVVDVIERALRKTPDERFPTAGDMRRALAAARLTLPYDFQEPSTALHEIPLPLDIRTPSSRTPAEFRRRRIELLELHLREARAAFVRGDVAEVTARAEAALVLDPDHEDAQRLLHLANEPRTEILRATEALPFATAPSGPAPWSPPSATPLPVASLEATAAKSTPAPGRVSAPPVPPSMLRPTDDASGAAAATGFSGPAIALAGAAAVVVLVGGAWLLWPTPTTPAPPARNEATVPAAPAVTTPPAVSEADRLAGETTRILADAAAAEAASRWSDARGHYQAVLTRTPDHPEARAGVARMDARLTAAASLTRKPPIASVEDRVRADGLVRRATNKYEAGDYDGAVEDLNQALKAVPAHEAAAALLKSVLRARETEAKLPRRPQPEPPR